MGDPSTDRLLLDRGLRARTIQLVGIESDAVRYRDRFGVLRTEPAGDWIAIVPAPRGDAAIPTPSAGAQVLTLGDGQRFVGTYKPRASGLLGGDEPIVAWESALFGPLQIAIDRVSYIEFVPSRIVPPPDLRDHVVLINGDVISGFVESMGEEVTIDADSRSMKLPIDRIASVTLAGRSEPVAGQVVWLKDGSTVALREVASSPGGLRVSLREPPRGAPRQTQGDLTPAATVSMSDVLALSRDASRLVELASLTPTDQSPAPGRRWTTPIRVRYPGLHVLGQGEIHIDGPMRITWSLPPHAARIRGVAELPEASRTWGDCVLIVSAVGADGESRELIRERIHGERHTIEFTAALPPASRRGATLIITLDEGAFGPVHDRLILRGALILLDPPSEP